jgi:hypothetical protein
MAKMARKAIALRSMATWCNPTVQPGNHLKTEFDQPPTGTNWRIRLGKSTKT